MTDGRETEAQALRRERDEAIQTSLHQGQELQTLRLQLQQARKELESERRYPSIQRRMPRRGHKIEMLAGGSWVPVPWVIEDPEGLGRLFVIDPITGKETGPLAAASWRWPHEAEPEKARPIPLLLVCPMCGERHVDEGEWATNLHHTHACQHCGTVWRPAVEHTVGVRFLPGFKNEAPTP